MDSFIKAYNEYCIHRVFSVLYRKREKCFFCKASFKYRLRLFLKLSFKVYKSIHTAMHSFLRKIYRLCFFTVNLMFHGTTTWTHCVQSIIYKDYLT